MVAAVAAIGLMAALAAMLVQSTASRIATTEGEVQQARLSAAADAGLHIALSGLLRDDPAHKWPIDGRTERRTFAGVPIDIRVEDERGKVMLNRIDEENIGWLLESMGLEGNRLAIARDSFMDWIDQDDDARENGAESEYYIPRGVVARNDAPQSVEELAEIRGFDPALVARIARVATIDSTQGAFDPHYADPIAIRAMTDGQDDSPDILERRREMGGQRLAIAFSDAEAWKNRAVMIHAVAFGPGDARAERRMVVEVTGAKSPRAIVRWTD
ncbi:MAG: hypothetical protein RIS94_3423 [Pseudomonadota bacterium]|jgi:general secretion pathway protein K